MTPRVPTPSPERTFRALMLGVRVWGAAWVVGAVLTWVVPFAISGYLDLIPDTANGVERSGTDAVGVAMTYALSWLAATLCALSRLVGATILFLAALSLLVAPPVLIGAAVFRLLRRADTMTTTAHTPNGEPAREILVVQECGGENGESLSRRD